MSNVRSACAAVCGLAAIALLSGTASALQYYDHTGTPGATVTLTETAPGSGVYQFFDDYIWNTNVATLEADGAKLGPWAASTFEYSVYQNTGVRNTLDLEGTFDYVVYQFGVPIPAGRILDSITVEASVNRGITARARESSTAGWTEEPVLFIGGASLDPAMSATVPGASIDAGNPSLAKFQLKFEQESGNFGYVDFLRVTAVTSPIPEPASVSVLALGATAILARRRRV